MARFQPYQMHTFSPPPLWRVAFHDLILPIGKSESERCNSTWGSSATAAGKKGGRFSGPFDGSWSIRGGAIRPLGGDRAGEVRFGRFLHNPNVTPEEMIATAAAHTASRVGGGMSWRFRIPPRCVTTATSTT